MFGMLTYSWDQVFNLFPDGSALDANGDTAPTWDSFHAEFKGDIVHLDPGDLPAVVPEEYYGHLQCKSKSRAGSLDG